VPELLLAPPLALPELVPLDELVACPELPPLEAAELLPPDIPELLPVDAPEPVPELPLEIVASMPPSVPAVPNVALELPLHPAGSEIATSKAAHMPDELPFIAERLHQRLDPFP
jgi:hypothetical protein